LHLIFCNRVESLETRISNYMMILENYITILPKKSKAANKDPKISQMAAVFSFCYREQLGGP